jgi:hypothetical protein
MTAWDPVGAGDQPEAWDEYDTYALQIARQLHEASDAEAAQTAVADYLTRTEVESMGIESEQRASANDYLASALVAWHEWSYARGGRPPRDWIDDD